MPMHMAVGMVTATVNVPHGLSPSAFTTTRPSAARMMIMIAERADQRDAAGDRAHLHLDHLAERAAVAPDRAEQDYEVLHRAGEHHADQNPERAGQITHLRRQHRPDQRPGARDGREMVTETTYLLVGT